MKKSLFQYAVILHKYKQENPQASTATATGSQGIYEDSEIVIEPTFILAKNAQDVIFKVTRLIPEDKATDPENVEILVRNF